MSDYPLISVIVPVYKVEKYLDQCIRSITQQTYQNLEIILVDDGSPDQSGAICDAWAKIDPRIQVIHQENGGGGAARNTGLDIARGEFISMIDSDDYLERHMYEHLLGLMQESVGITECTVVMTESDHQVLDDGVHAQITDADRIEAMRLHIRDELFCQTPPNKLYRRSVIGDIRFPVGNLIDDEFFTYQVIGNCKKLVHSSAMMYAYRQQPGSAMHKPFSIKRLQGLQAKKQRLEYLRKNIPELVNEAKEDLYLSCIYSMQGSLRSLQGNDLETARGIIGELRKELMPLEDLTDLSIKKKVLFFMARINFEGTCWLLNFLIDIHVLT